MQTSRIAALWFELVLQGQTAEDLFGVEPLKSPIQSSHLPVRGGELLL